MLKCLLFYIILFLLLTSLFADLDIIDEDDIVNEDEHFFQLQDLLDIDIKYNLSTYNRYQDRYSNLKTVNRASINIKNTTLKLLYQTNTNRENPDYPYGASLMYNNKKRHQLALGQFQVAHAYGLLLHRGSFISQKPSFSTNFTSNSTNLSANPRPYYSSALFGVAYNTTISEHFSYLLFSSLKDTAVRLDDGKIATFTPDEALPKNTASHSLSGAIFSLNISDLRVSSATLYSHANKEFASKHYPLSTSLAASYNYDQYLFFTENALSNNKLAHLAGVKSQYQRFTQILAYRRFQPEYHAIYANYLSRIASGENEQGVLYKLTYTTSQYMVQTFGDIFANIENQERYHNKNQGVSWGVQIEKYALFNYDDMTLSATFRENYDKEWRNFTGITRYEDRKREYYNVQWQQCDTDFLTSKLTFNYQKKAYPDYDMSNHGYSVDTSLTMRFEWLKTTLCAGIFESDLPLYIYLYSGRLNNPLYLLNGEGQFGLLHLSSKLFNKLTFEVMTSFLNKTEPEYSSSLLMNYEL